MSEPIIHPIYTVPVDNEHTSSTFSSLIFSCSICGTNNNVSYVNGTKQYCSKCWEGMIDLLAKMYKKKIEGEDI